MSHKIENQFKEVEQSITCNGLTISFDQFLKTWGEYGPNRVIEVNPKMIFYNTGPTGYDKKIGFKVSNFYSEKRGESPTIFVIWYRNDGCGIRVFQWMGTYEEWKLYQPQDITPHAIQQEWGIEK